MATGGDSCDVGGGVLSLTRKRATIEPCDDPEEKTGDTGQAIKRPRGCVEADEQSVTDLRSVEAESPRPVACSANASDGHDHDGSTCGRSSSICSQETRRQKCERKPRGVYRQEFSRNPPCQTPVPIALYVGRIYAWPSLGDLTDHVKTSVHDRNSAARANTRSIPSMFMPGADSSVINAEMLFTDFLGEHNIALSVANHAGNLFSKMFPDSQVAKKFSCGRTKTSQIVKTFALEDSSHISNCLKSGAFSLATDGSGTGQGGLCDRITLYI